MAGMKGASAIIGHNFITGETVEEHDAILRKVVERATNKNLKLNLTNAKSASQVYYIWVTYYPVSYTHLTLPTICSV